MVVNSERQLEKNTTIYENESQVTSIHVETGSFYNNGQVYCSNQMPLRQNHINKTSDAWAAAFVRRGWKTTSCSIYHR